MKRTKISFRECVDEKIEIIAIENVASYEEIQAEFSEEVMAAYKLQYPHYTRRDFANLVVYHNKKYFSKDSFSALHELDIFPKKEFWKIIEEIKKAGENFCRIKKEAARAKIKTIII